VRAARRWSRARGLTEWRLEATAVGRTRGWPTERPVGRARRPLVHAGALALSPWPGPTVNVGRLVAGTADFVLTWAAITRSGHAAPAHVVPDRALAEGELRFLSPADGRGSRGRTLGARRQLSAVAQCVLAFRSASPFHRWILTARAPTGAPDGRAAARNVSSSSSRGIAADLVPELLET